MHRLGLRLGRFMSDLLHHPGSLGTVRSYGFVSLSLGWPTLRRAWLGFLVGALCGYALVFLKFLQSIFEPLGITLQLVDVRKSTLEVCCRRTDRLRREHTGDATRSVIICHQLAL
jgi:hypothetical protein